MEIRLNICALCALICIALLAPAGCSNYESQDEQALLQTSQSIQVDNLSLAAPHEEVFEGRRSVRRTEGVKPFKRDYLLGPEDALEIMVLLSPELDRKIRIGLDGYISYPLIGRIFATGLTAYELEQQIAELLGEKYLKEPQVSVLVTEYRSRWAAVIGGVEVSGIFPLTKPVNTLVELLSRAGGLSKGEQRLAAHKLYVIPARQQFRQEGSSEETVAEGQEEPLEEEPAIYTISVHELLETGNPALNIEIIPGDIIYVPTTEFYFVVGEVERPGAYALKKKMTVMQALAEAGSFTDLAAVKDAKVTKRLPDGREVSIAVNFMDIINGKAEDIPIAGGDILYVDKSTLKVVGATSKEYAKALSTAALSGFASAFAFEASR